jgi:hypothetical protein
MDDCDYDYGVMIEQIYFMCDLCLPLGNCDEMWNSDDRSDLDQSECEDNADCNWNDYDMMCDDLYCSDLDQSECEDNDDCEWDDYYMMCDEVSDDGPPECWLDCEGSEVLTEDMTGTELCTWFVPVYEDGSCLGDCDGDDLFMSSMIYSMCGECLLDDSCDDMFDDGSCSDLDQSECEDEDECQWNDYDMMCEDMDCSTLLDEASCEDNGFCEWNDYDMECESSDDDGPPDCMMDCPGIMDVNPDEDPTAFCSWFIPIYDDGTCLSDCEDELNSELDEAYYLCQECLVEDNCDEMWDSEDCSDLDQSDCEDNEDCNWNDYDMMCEDADDCPSEGENEACWAESCSWTSGLTDEWFETIPNYENEGQFQGFCESLSELAEGDLDCADSCVVEGCGFGDMMWLMMYCDSCVNEDSCNDIYNINICNDMIYCSTEFTFNDCDYIVGDPICTEDDFYQLTGECDLSVCDDGGEMDNGAAMPSEYAITSVYPSHLHHHKQKGHTHL